MLNRPHIVLLPGLDGTGKLFSPIIPFLKNQATVHVVQYSNEQSFEEYVESAKAQLPNEDSISLVGESFSGPIVIELLAREPNKFEACVLSATFCKSPLPLITQLSTYLPQQIFSSNPVSKAFLDLFVSGTKANQEVRELTHMVIDEVSPSTFKSRIKIVNEVDVSEQLKEISVPLLYIQATKDKIVFNDAYSEIVKHAKNIKIAKVQAPHMVLQTQPKLCAELILGHVISNKRIHRTASQLHCSSAGDA